MGEFALPEGKMGGVLVVAGVFVVVALQASFGRGELPIKVVGPVAGDTVELAVGALWFHGQTCQFRSHRRKVNGKSHPVFAPLKGFRFQSVAFAAGLCRRPFLPGGHALSSVAIGAVDSSSGVGCADPAVEVGGMSGEDFRRCVGSGRGRTGAGGGDPAINVFRETTLRCGEDGRFGTVFDEEGFEESRVVVIVVATGGRARIKCVTGVAGALL